LIAVRCSLASAKASSPASIIDPADPMTETGSSWLVDLSSQKVLGSFECIGKNASAGFTQPRSFSISRRNGSSPNQGLGKTVLELLVIYRLEQGLPRGI
jgi:hypothetical protein